MKAHAPNARRSAAPRRFDPFRPLAPAARRRHLDTYAGLLAQRDGTPDLAALTLPRREAWFEELARKPVAWNGDVDEAGFRAHFAGTGAGELDPRTVWLVAIAKANEGERYGVEIELRRFPRLAARGFAKDPFFPYMMLEERYHTRLLLEACRACGIAVEPRAPARLQRTLIEAMMYLPDRLRWIPVLAGETIGTAVFRRMREACGLFAAQPEVEERLRSVLDQIWIDEVLHVAYLRARLGPRALRAARSLVPFVAASVTRDVPQLDKLGCTAQQILEDLREGVEIPAEIDWIADAF